MGERPRPAVRGPRWFGLLSGADALLGLLAAAVALLAAAWYLYATLLAIDQVLTPTADGMASHDRAVRTLTVLGWTTAGAVVLMLLVDLPVLVISALRARAWGLSALLALGAVLTGTFLPLLLAGTTWAATNIPNESVSMSVGFLALLALVTVVPIARLTQLVLAVMDVVHGSRVRI